jgi:hypothetical protein
MWRSTLLLPLVLCLLGCADRHEAGTPEVARLASMQPSPQLLRPYPDTGQFLQCVPFARVVSGIDIYGDAWTWWDSAGRQKRDRGTRPAVGAVLVLKRSAQLPTGHVAVVAELGDPRHALLTHANWGADGDTRGVIHERMPIMDVSPANDWSQIRLMNRYGQFGRVYAAYGFIYPPRPPAVASR